MQAQHLGSFVAERFLVVAEVARSVSTQRLARLAFERDFVVRDFLRWRGDDRLDLAQRRQVREAAQAERLEKRRARPEQRTAGSPLPPKRPAPRPRGGGPQSPPSFPPPPPSAPLPRRLPARAPAPAIAASSNAPPTARRTRTGPSGRPPSSAFWKINSA